MGFGSLPWGIHPIFGNTLPWDPRTDVSVALKPAGYPVPVRKCGVRVLTCEIAGGVPPPASEVSPGGTPSQLAGENAGATLATVAAGFLVDEAPVHGTVGQVCQP